MGDENDFQSDPNLEKQQQQEDTNDNGFFVSTSTAPEVPPPLLQVTTTTSSLESIRVVVQRFRQCTLLVHDNAITVGESSSSPEHRRRRSSLIEPSSSASSTTTTTKSEAATTSLSSSGMLAYISFASLATKEKTLAAAKMLVHLPILTMGAWGDGSDTSSVLDMASSLTTVAGGSPVNIVLVPQANVICKVRSQGRSIQYHGQIDKRQGKVLYELFVDYVKALCLEHQCKTRNQSVPTFVTNLLSPSAKNSVDVGTPPTEMFRDWTLYSAWDEWGIPLKDSSGQPLTKSATKKCKKLMEVHAKKHQKYLLDWRSSIGQESSALPEEEGVVDWTLLDDRTFIRIVAGIFGARQGLEMLSDMGPFCHVVNL